VVLLIALNYRGVTKTAILARILLACTVIALAAVVIGIAVTKPEPAQLMHWPTGTIYGVLQSAGLLFFAFAGYARIATMGEEVRDPARTIPRAITLALAIAVAIYFVVGVAALLAAGPDRLAHAAAPLAEAVRAAGLPALVPVITVGAALASLGALLALVAGLGRTVLAMARHRDLPAWLAAVHPRYRVPHHAEVALGVVVCILVATVDLRGVIGFSSFGVLIYYAIANASAYTLPASDATSRRRILNVCGLAGCLLLVATLPWQSVFSGLAVFAVGLIGRAVVLRLR
jgi:APA family basic amino acid/polyamine antiporter